MAFFSESKWVWKNGKIIPWEEATDPHVGPRPALRDRRLRRHSLLQHGGRSSGVPSRCSPGAHVRVGTNLRPTDSILSGRADAGRDRRYQRQRILGLLRASHRYLRQRKPGRASAELSGGSRDAGVAVGRVPRRRCAGERHPGNRFALEEVQLTGHAGDSQSLRAVSELDAGGAGCGALRLRRGVAGGRRRNHRRRFGRELLHGEERQCADQRRTRPRADGNYARLGDYPGARSGLQGVRRPDAFGRTGSCGRGIFYRYRSGGDSDQRAGSQADRQWQARPGHIGVAAGVSSRPLQDAIRSTRTG